MAPWDFSAPFPFDDLKSLRPQTERRLKFARRSFEVLVGMGCNQETVLDRMAGDYGLHLELPVTAAARRQRRLAEAPGEATPTQVAARVEFYGGRCWICREQPSDCLDHVKPIAKGGSKWPANLRPACRSCNSKKRDCWPFPTGRIA